jgi:MFS family permease
MIISPCRPVNDGLGGEDCGIGGLVVFYGIVFYFVIPLALIALGAIVYAALSKKSGPRTRRAALIALAFMLLSVIVCAVLILTGVAGVEGGELRPPDLPVEETVPPGNDLWVLLAFILFFAVLFVVVAILSFREERRRKEALKKKGPRAA